MCMGSFTVSFFYFCLCVCKSITLVQSVLIQSFIGEDVLTTLNSGCCWVVWTATGNWELQERHICTCK